jgi:predicted HicB family RNase H-like nuclease
MRLKHKDYIAEVSFDTNQNLFIAEIINQVGFGVSYGKDEKEVKRQFEFLIDGYLDYCKEKELTPAKPFQMN